MQVNFPMAIPSEESHFICHMFILKFNIVAVDNIALLVLQWTLRSSLLDRRRQAKQNCPSTEKVALHLGLNIVDVFPAYFNKIFIDSMIVISWFLLSAISWYQLDSLCNLLYNLLSDSNLKMSPWEPVEDLASDEHSFESAKFRYLR